MGLLQLPTPSAKAGHTCFSLSLLFHVSHLRFPSWTIPLIALSLSFSI